MKYGKPPGGRSAAAWEKAQAEARSSAEWVKPVEELPMNALFFIPGYQGNEPRLFKKGCDYDTNCTADLVYPLRKKAGIYGVRIERLPKGTPVYSPPEALLAKYDKAWGFEESTADYSARRGEGEES